MRAFLVILFVAASCTGAWADEPAGKPGRYARQLARECDDLIASALKRPYGWAWAEVRETADAKPGAARNVPVSLQPMETPAAGLVLLYSSQLLKEPKYFDAALNVGRGVAAAQQPVGKFPATALFGPTSATSKEPLRPLPDRASTRVSLALLLSLVDEANPRETIDRSASRGAVWLMRQQAESGAWLTIYPPNAKAADGTRVARLDTPEARDCMLTMMLAYEVLGDPFQRRSVEKSAAFLMKARITGATNFGAGLWQSAYTGTGIAVDQIAEFPASVDTLASRYTMESLLSTWVILGDGQRLAAAESAWKSLNELIKGDDNLWHRRFSFKGASLDPPPKPPAFIGETTAPPADDPLLPPLVRTLAVARDLGREKFRAKLGANFTPKQCLAQVISGLSEEPMSADFPSVMEEAQDYLKRHEQDFKLIEGETPAGLSAKVRRLWWVYLRAKVEVGLGV
jgi:hypothetical protein